MSKANNWAIPRKAIARAAGLGDSNEFSINIIDTKIYFEGKEVKIPYNVVSKSLKREILSTELMEGMSIEAVTYENRNKIIENIEK